MTKEIDTKSRETAINTIKKHTQRRAKEEEALQAMEKLKLLKDILEANNFQHLKELILEEKTKEKKAFQEKAKRIEVNNNKIQAMLRGINNQ